MATPVASLYRASLWTTVAVTVLLSGCSGGTTAPGSGGAPAGSTPDPGAPSDPAPSDPAEPPPSSGPAPATDTVVSLTWQPNTDAIAGYIVYYGPTPEAATTLAVQLALASFNGAPPNVRFNAGRDLGLAHGDGVCFRLRAYNDANVLSAWSAAACGTI